MPRSINGEMGQRVVRNAENMCYGDAEKKRSRGDTVENTEIRSLFFVALFQSGACAECISLPAELTPASRHVFRLESLSYVSLSLEH